MDLIFFYLCGMWANPEQIFIPDEIERVKKKTNLYAFLRILTFFLILTVVILSLSKDTWFFLAFLPLSVVFVVFIKRFNASKDQEAYFLALLEMRKDRQNRSLRKLQDFDKGGEFADKQHPFADDLDLFGQHSLFQLLNHTASASGKAHLARWMKSQLHASEAKKKKAAVDELKKDAELVAKFEALGKAFLKEGKTQKSFLNWLEEKENWVSWYIFPMILGPILGSVILMGSIFSLFVPGILGLWLLICIGFLAMVFFPLKEASTLWPNMSDIKTLKFWAQLLEKKSFESAMLQEMHSPILGKNEGGISKGLQSLERISFLMENRLNLMYVVFNLFFLLDYFLLWQLKNWKQKYGHELAQVEEVFDQWQVLVSLAAFSQEENLNGEIIWTTQKTLATEQMVHPLLQRRVAVANDFSLSGDESIVLLTGSNMSGKTTFMRTLGINMVLANMGLSAFTKSLTIGPFSLYTSMRNTDNLGESVSSFYAELSRIKKVLEAAAGGEPIFCLLDEMLKGTNTADRIMGSEALIRQLADSGAKGIISTHDIELSSLSEKLDYLINYSFHSEIKANQIDFDYKLKSGPCPSFNAHKLMELMGIRFEDKT